MAEGNGNAAKWIAIGCLAAIVFLCCCCGGLGGMIWQLGLKAPQGAARGFLADVRAHQYENVLKRMDAGYQSTHDVRAVQQAVEAIPALSQHTADSLMSVNVQQQTATVGGELSTPRGPAQVEFTLSLSAGHWYISTVKVDGQLLQ